jgi:hypothetical protein
MGEGVESRSLRSIRDSALTLKACAGSAHNQEAERFSTAVGASHTSPPPNHPTLGGQTMYDVRDDQEMARSDHAADESRANAEEDLAAYIADAHQAVYDAIQCFYRATRAAKAGAQTAESLGLEDTEDRLRKIEELLDTVRHLAAITLDSISVAEKGQTNG